MKNKMQLRSYQLELKDKIRAGIASHKRVIATLATGGGKTLLFSEIAKTSVGNGYKVLIICETLVIKDQITKIAPSGVILMMAQTLRRRDLQPFKEESKLLIIVDECHINISLPILEELPNAYLVGFTATPIFQDKKRAKATYKALVEGAQNQELISMGFLSECRHYARVKKSMEPNSSNEYSEGVQLDFLGKVNATNAFIEDLAKEDFKDFKKMVVFCVNIKHAESVYDALKINGYNALLIHSQSDTDVSMFTSGTYKIAVCVAMLTKGFDCPNIDTVVLLRATKSVSLYLQMLGRGARICEGKKGFAVLDYGTNGIRLGLFSEKRDWQRIWDGKARGKSKGVGGVKDCKKCGALIPSNASVCRHCGAVVEVKKERKNGVANTHLVELKSAEIEQKKRELEAMAKDYAALAKSGHYNAAVLLARKANNLDAFSKEMGYKKGWAWFQRKKK